MRGCTNMTVTPLVTWASFISRWKRLRRLATGAPLLKQGRPLSAIKDTVAMMGSATVRAW